MLYWIKRLEDAKRIPVLPVYVDSPMAIGALQFYTNRMNELDPELHPAEHALCAFCTSRLTTVDSVEQSKALVASREPAIVIAASGMATGGRVLHHLDVALPDERNTVLFVGYQAAGTRGRHARRRREAGQDARAARPRPRAHRPSRLDVGARRRRRDHALALGLHSGRPR